MFNFISLNSIYTLLLHYGYFIFFPIMVLEGPIVTVIAGFLASLGYFNLFVLYLLAVAGDLVGDILYYLLGRYGGTRFINKWGKYLSIDLKNIEKLEDLYRHHGGKTLLLGKLTQVAGAAVLVAAGVARMRLRRFMLFNTIITVPKSLLFVLIGYYFGRSYAGINNFLNLLAFLTLISLAALFYVNRKKITSYFYEDITS